jgi:hypothetical protein
VSLGANDPGDAGLQVVSATSISCRMLPFVIGCSSIGAGGIENLVRRADGWICASAATALLVLHGHLLWVR